MSSFDESTDDHSDDEFYDAVDPSGAEILTESATIDNQPSVANRSFDEILTESATIGNQPSVANRSFDEITETSIEPRPEITKSIEMALEYKEKGNKSFRSREYDEAIDDYSRAIAHCPLDEDSKENLSVFLGNRAAAYFAVGEFDQTVEDCNKSLDLNPSYVKVLIRRCQAFEKLGKVEEALADAKKIQEIDPASPKIAETIARLEKEYEEKMTKLKDEALGKLKELGNSILGNFGMSLDNFKMQQDPATGGWSMSMKN